MDKPSATELMEGFSSLNTKKEVEAYLRGELIEDGKPIVNKNHLTEYARQFQKIDASMMPAQLQYIVETKAGQKVQHYAVKVIYDIQGMLTKDTGKDAGSKAVASQSQGKHEINALEVIATAKECLKSKNWREKLVGCQILTGRRLGAIAFEASFEPVNSAMIRVISGQKKRGDVSECIFPVLEDSQVIIDAIEAIREGIRYNHTAVYERWLENASIENGHKFTRSINGSPKWKEVQERIVRPLFAGHDKNSSHDLRGIYGSIMWKAHEALTGSANPSHFVQMILDHEAVGITQTYLAYRLVGLTEVIDEASDEFCQAMDSAIYQKLEKTYMPFDVESFLSVIGDESARTEIASLLTDSESFAVNLGREFDRLYRLSRQVKPAKPDSAGARIERVVKAIMDHNVSQLGSAEPLFAEVTTKLVSDAGKVIYGTTFYPGSMREILGGMDKGAKVHGSMEDEINAHHEAMMKEGMKPNQNLFYRRGNKMEAILEGIAAQHGSV